MNDKLVQVIRKRHDRDVILLADNPFPGDAHEDRGILLGKLESLLPKPTIFTKSPESWPEDGQEFFVRRVNYPSACILTWDKYLGRNIMDNDGMGLIGATWWPVGGLFQLEDGS